MKKLVTLGAVAACLAVASLCSTATTIQVFGTVNGKPNLLWFPTFIELRHARESASCVLCRYLEKYQ